MDDVTRKIADRYLIAAKPLVVPVAAYADWLVNNPSLGKQRTLTPTLRGKLMLELNLNPSAVSMRFFSLLDQLFHIGLGAPAEDLSGELRTSAKVLSRVLLVRLGDERGAELSNDLTDFVVENLPNIRRIGASTPEHFPKVALGNIGADVALLIEKIARSVNLSAGAVVKTTEGLRWPTIKILSKRDEAMKSLQENNPELYEEITANTEAAKDYARDAIITSDKVPTTVIINGVSMPAGADYVSGEKTVYVDGKSFDEPVYRKIVYMQARKDKLITSEFASMYTFDDEGKPVPVRRPEDLSLMGIRKLSDADLLNPDVIPENQKVDFRALTDDKSASNGTRIYPTKKDVNGDTIIMDGRFKGFHLDDMVNANGRLVEGAAYDMDGSGAPVAFNTLDETGELRLASVNKEPYVTLNSKGQFLIKIPVVRGGGGKKDPYKLSRDRMKALSSKPDKTVKVKNSETGKTEKKITKGRTRGTSIMEQLSVGEDEPSGTLFTFDAINFATVREAVGGMCMSAEAAKKIREFYAQQARQEDALRKENLKSYSLGRIGGFKSKIEIDPETGAPYDPPKPVRDLLSKQMEALSWIEAKGYKGLAALDTGVGKCTKHDTLTYTNRGMVQIKDINPGLTVPDTQAPVEGWSVLVGGELLPVKAFYYAGTKPTLKVRTRNGYEVEGSLIHPVMTRGPNGESFTKLPDLKVGDFVCIERRDGDFVTEEPTFRVPPSVNGSKTYAVPDRMTPDLARLLGYIVAEGWVNTDRGFCISQDGSLNPEVNTDIVGLCRSQLGYDVRPDDLSKYVSSTFLRTYLEWMGVDYTLSADKCIPPVVMQSTRESVIQFIRAYMDAEGSVCENGLEVSSASERLLRELQVVLLRLGVVSSRNPKKVAGNPHTYWRLSITGDNLRRYREVVGMVSSRKTAMLDLLCERNANSNTNVTPHAVGMVEELRSEIFLRAGGQGKGGGLNKRFGHAFVHTLTHVRQGRRNPTYGFLGKMLSVAETVGAVDTDAYRVLSAHVANNYFYDPIETITPGFTEVMDIMVDDPRHTFVGNGVVNHNTLLTIATMQKMVRDGSAGEGSRFLYVCPGSLKGTFPRELESWMTKEAAKGLTSLVDRMSYEDFAFNVNGGIKTVKVKVPGTEELERVLGEDGKPVLDAKGKPTYKAIEGTEKMVSEKIPVLDVNGNPVLNANGKPKMKAKKEKVIPDSGFAKKFAAVFFDEAQALVKNENSSLSLAAQRLNHPRKILLTASPMEDSPDELYIGVAITNNVVLGSGKRGALTQERKDLMAFRRRFCVRVAGRTMGIKNEPEKDPTARQDFDAWVKNGMYFADKTTIGEEGTSEEEKKKKLPKLHKQPVSLTMDPEVEIEYRKATKGVAKLLKLMTAVFRDNVKITGESAKLVAGYKGALKKHMTVLNQLSNYPDEVIDPETGEKKFPGAVSTKVVGATTIVGDKISGGKRTLLFTDDPKFAVKSAEQISAKTPGHRVAVALNDRVLVYENGSHKSSKETTFTQRAYTNINGDKVPKDQWASHVLSEIIGGDPSVKALILTKKYALGQNLQMFSTVVLLDRDTFSSETMKQRTARAWRTGQKEPVEEYTMDAVYDSASGKDDPTLDEVRKYVQDTQQNLFNEIVHKSRETVIGQEWEGMQNTPASMVNVNRKLFELAMAPYPAGLAEFDYNQAVKGQ